MPQLARLGFDDGWLVLGPHFLNLGLPVLIDHRLIDSAETLGLEPFGTRDPRQPLRPARVRVGIAGGGVWLWSSQRSRRALLAAHWFEPIPGALLAQQSLGVVFMTGDTYAVQLSWSALWTCRIGIAALRPLSLSWRRREALLEPVG